MQGRVKVSFTNEFKKNLKTLAKKYINIKTDVTPYIARLEAGETPGDQIKGTEHRVFKVRLPNSSANKGKRSGFRLIYYLKIPEEIILLSIYSKSTQQDISSSEILNIIKSHTI